MSKENRETLLKVENLCQYFKLDGKELKAVDGISFEIYKGEVFGLVGESGCGKTTAGRSIIKLYDCTAGNVYFKDQRICAGTRKQKDGIKKAKVDLKKFIASLKDKNISGNEKDVLVKEETDKTNAVINHLHEEIKSAEFDKVKCDREYSDRIIAQLKSDYKLKIDNAKTDEERLKYENKLKNRIKVAKKERLVNKIQMIFQDPIASLDPRMTVREIVAEGLIIKGEKDKEFIDQQVNSALEAVGLVREHADRYPHEFSGGQRQRIGIARSVITHPELIIADEPISALDVSIQAQVINLLNDLRKELGLTILFIAHDLSVVKYFSDRIGVMYFGKLVEIASSDKLFKNPMHPYTRSLLSAIPLPDPIYEKTRKRIVYNPDLEHDYTVDKPSMREIEEGHFVLCNQKEFEENLKNLK